MYRPIYTPLDTGFHCNTFGSSFIYTKFKKNFFLIISQHNSPIRRIYISIYNLRYLEICITVPAANRTQWISILHKSFMKHHSWHTYNSAFLTFYWRCISTCFGRIYAHHQEVQPYVYNNWYLLFFQMTGCCAGWIGFQSNQDNRQYEYIRLYLLMMGLDTPETCRGWQNILRISCGFSLLDYIIAYFACN
jgi:hypothetical protein